MTAITQTIEAHEKQAQQFKKEGRDRLAITEYEMLLKLLDKNSPKLAEVYLELAERWRHLGKRQKSIPYYISSIEQTIALKESIMHEDLSYLYLELAQYFRQIIREKPAKIYFEKALKSAIIAYGDNSKWVQRIRMTLVPDL